MEARWGVVPDVACINAAIKACAMAAKDKCLADGDSPEKAEAVYNAAKLAAIAVLEEMIGGREELRRRVSYGRLAAPYYVIAAGADGTGLVLARNLTGVDGESALLPTTMTTAARGTGSRRVVVADGKTVVEDDDDDEQDGWFLVQTNYDHWKADPAFDPRRAPGGRVPRAGVCLRGAGRRLLGRRSRGERLRSAADLSEGQAGKVPRHVLPPGPRPCGAGRAGEQRLSQRRRRGRRRWRWRRR